MDINILIIAAAIVVTSAIVLYMISLLTMKDKTFEEVMDEQKRQAEAESERLRSLKKADKELIFKKKLKKKPDKVKEKSKGTTHDALTVTPSKADVLKPMKQPEVMAVKPLTQVVQSNVASVVKAAPAEQKNQVKNESQKASGHKDVSPKAVAQKAVADNNVSSKDGGSKGTKEVIQKGVAQKVAARNGTLEKGSEQKAAKSAKEKGEVGKMASHNKGKSDQVDGASKGKEIKEVIAIPEKVKGVMSSPDVQEEVKENVSPKVKKSAAKSQNEAPTKVMKNEIKQRENADTIVSHTKPNETVQEKKKSKREAGDKTKASPNDIAAPATTAASTQSTKTATIQPTKMAAIQPTKLVVEPTKMAVEQPINRKHASETASPPGKSAKQQAKPTPHVEDGISDVMTLLECIKKCRLSEADIHTVIEALHGKCGNGAAFISIKKKGDPLAMLRNQLEEKEKSLQEEQQMVMAANSKLKTMKAELLQEHARYSQLEKSSLEKMASQTQEVQALQARMQQSHESHLRDIEVVRQQNEAIIRTISEENQELKESVKKAHAMAQSSDVDNLKKKVEILQTEMNNNAIKLNASEREKKSLEQAIDKKVGNEKVMSQRLEEMMQQFNKEESNNKKLNLELHKSTEAVNAAKKECQNLKTKLKELEKNLKGLDHSSRTMDAKLKNSEKEKVQLTDRVRTLEQQLHGADSKCADMTIQLQELQTDNGMLRDELKMSQERLQQAEEASAYPVGTCDASVQTETLERCDTIELTQHESMLAEKDGEMSKLLDELNRQSEMISEITAQVDLQKQKNNELREKNWKAMSALEAAEKFAQAKLDDTIEHLVANQEKALADCRRHGKESFERIFPNIHIDSQLANQEKALADCRRHGKESFERIFPNIHIDSQFVHVDWVTHFEHQAIQYLRDLSTKSHQPAEMNKVLQKELHHSKEQIEELRAKLSHMDGKLSETEDKMALAVKIAEESQTQIADANTRLAEMEATEGEVVACRAELQEAERHIEALEVQIDEYRNVLSETEEKFRELEGNVDIEEKKWRAQVNQCEADLFEAREELKKFAMISEMNTVSDNQSVKVESDIGFAYRCVEKSLTNIVDEMQDRAEKLDIELKLSEQNRQMVQDQLAENHTDKVECDIGFAYCSVEESFGSIVDEMQDRAEKLDDALKVSEQSRQAMQDKFAQAQENITRLQVQLDAAEKCGEKSTELQAAIDEMKQNVQDEKARSKTFASEIVKLKAIVKIGQDALQEEQNLVNQLQLNQAGGDQTSGSSEETIALKEKLLETQKHLERELAVNHQLNQRLLAASSGADIGTSV